MSARDVMNTSVTTIAATARLVDAARMMVNGRVGILPVVDDEGALVGILSEHDLLGHEKAPGLTGSDSGSDDAERALSAPVASVMIRNVVVATERDELAEITALMVKHRVKHIPVVRGRSVVGIVSRLDLVKAMLSPGPASAAEQDGVPASDSDALRESVVAAIQRLGLPLGAAFDVVVRNGIVHLWGQVADPEQEVACRRVTAAIPGVAEVLSHMQVIARRPRLR